MLHYYYMTFIFDLDDTILDTAKLKDIIFKDMADCGASMEDVSTTYVECTNSGNLYSPEKHISLLKAKNPNIDEKEIMSRLGIINWEALIIPGSKEMIDEAKRMGQVILLTKGNYSFQARKLVGMGIEDWFNDVIITPSAKEKVIEQMNMETDVFVINDKTEENEAMKKVKPNWTYIHTQNLRTDWGKIKSDLV